jgi:predicted phage terminase large subunit-like protein
MDTVTTRSASSATGSTLSSIPPPETLRAIRSELGPRFANDQQREFFDTQASEVLYSGAFGAGKSRILCEKALYLALRYPNAPLALVRKVKASIAATTKITFMRDVLRPSGVAFKQNKTEDWIEFPNGSRITFFGLDADTDTGLPSKVGSFDGAWIGVDEAVELNESDWVMLEGRLRSEAIPYRQLAAATNPADPNHWLKRRFSLGDPERLYLHAGTFANRFLPDDYKRRMARLEGLYLQRYAEGQWVSVEGALWSPDDFIGYRSAPDRWVDGTNKPEYRRIVVGVDPAVTSNKHSDETGIIVAGIGVDGRGYVIDDLSGKFTPDQWGKRVEQAFRDYLADAIVVEVNQGGDLVKANLLAGNENLPVIDVHASKGKYTRAEPIARMYREGRISHVRRFVTLENQLCAFDPTSNVSPDRMDALVWAFTELMLEPSYSGDQFSMIA